MFEVSIEDIQRVLMEYGVTARKIWCATGILRKRGRCGLY